MRNHLFDNAKALLMLLVVFGHIIEPTIDDVPLIKAIYLTVYSFHMPAFILISGMFAKNLFSDAHMKNSIKGIVVPFICFEVIYELYSFISTGNVSGYLLGIQPHWILWYLLSLFFWKALAPMVNQCRYPLTLSILVAIAAGYCEEIGYFLGMSRTIVFFPFFLAGLNAKNYLTHFHCSAYMKLASVFIFVTVFFIFLKYPMARPGWFYGSYPYSVFNLADWHASLYRICTYGLSGTLILAFLCLVPTNQSYLTRLGVNTLSIYLWHGLLIKIMSDLDIMKELLIFTTPSHLAIAAAISVVMTAILGLDIIQKLTTKLVFNPIEKLIFSDNLTKPEATN